MFGIIYLTQNKENGMIYIGSDTKNQGKGDPNYLGSGLLLKRSIEKYGKENFEKRILDFCDSQEDLKEKENFFIKKYSSNDREIGYNISDGYWGGDTLSNHPDLENIRKKLSIKSKEVSKETTEKRKQFYQNESKEAKEIRISNLKKAMRNCDKSFFETPKYRKNLSEGIKNSEKFKEYQKSRIGRKRGKYSLDKNSSNQKRVEIINQLKSYSFKDELNKMLKKDHSTFSCYSQIYLHLDGIKKIEGLDIFIEFLEKNIYSNKLKLQDIKKIYQELELDKKKIGKSTSIVKSIYNFNKFRHCLIDVCRKF